jgi:hypothetical protein
MESIEAGAHRLDDGTTIYFCNCSTCLRKTGGRNLQISKATYFRHKHSRLASLPPVPLNIAPDLPSPDLPQVPVPAESSSSKRLQADIADEEVRSRKKGRSDSPELVPSFEVSLILFYTLTYYIAMISPNPSPMTRQGWITTLPKVQVFLLDHD